MTLSLEEVVRHHFDAQKQRPQEQDANLRRLRAEHLKARGDEAIKQGNYREAWERYSEAISLKPGKEGLHALYGNRSLAYCKGQRYGEALADADTAAELAPAWHKAQWRRAAALLALKRAPEAVLALRDAWRLAKGGPGKDVEAAAECEARLWQAVQRLTREQLARGVLQLLADLEQAALVRAPQVEAASEEEQVEGMLILLRAAHQGQPRPGPYYRRYLAWLQQGMQPGEAYIERAAVHSAAKCYLQARADAAAAVAALRSQQQQEQQEQQQGEQQQRGLGAAAKKQLALAYRRLGKACLAQRQHEDRDCRKAAKAFLQAVELDPGCSAAQEGLQEASEHLTMVEIDQVQLELYNEGSSSIRTSSGADGAAAASALPGQRIFQVALRLGFPTPRAADCTSRARELLRRGLAVAAGVDPLKVSIERVLAPTAARQHLAVLMHVQVGADLLKASSLAKAVNGGSSSSSQPEQQPPEGSAETKQQQELAVLLGGAPLAAVLGQPDPRHCSAEIEDITPACAGASEAERAQQEAVQLGDAEVAPEQDLRLAAPARPKLEIELPYKLYKLVRADGSLAERADKHPFCMSRVYYDATEKPEEVWAELADGSCRWRQTGGEVKVLALRVPKDLPTKQLAVAIEPYSLKVWNRSSGEVYLEGGLERGVVPEDCFWTHCGGEGEDGCALYLRKMNLELLQKHWMHSEMWWPRLFKAHGEIAWDDYEKDYSDLPEEVLQRHRVAEAIKDDERRGETTEKERREALQERDDVRKRARQERLHELRTGARQSWVQLNRRLPAVDAF